MKLSIRKTGFTLVELLSVIAIIGILLSIMMPALRGVREKSRQTACLSHLQQIGYGEFMYSMDNNDYFPDKKTVGGFPFRAAPGYRDPKVTFGYPEIYGLIPVLEKYVNYDPKSDIWVCPGQPHQWMRELGNTYWFTIGNVSFTNVKNASKTGIAGDNYRFSPYDPGFPANGMEPKYVLDEDDQIVPHSYVNGGKGEVSILYADCHAAELGDH